MRKELILGFLVSIMFIPGSVALDIDVSESDKERVNDAITSNIDEIPKPVRNIVGNEDVNVRVEDRGVIGVKLDGLQIDEVVEDGLDNPDVLVNVSDKAYENVTESDNPKDALKQNYRSGEITIEVAESDSSSGQEESSDADDSDSSDSGEGSQEDSSESSPGIADRVDSFITGVKIQVATAFVSL